MVKSVEEPFIMEYKKATEGVQATHESIVIRNQKERCICFH